LGVTVAFLKYRKWADLPTQETSVHAKSSCFLWYNRTHVNFIDAAASGAANAISLVANIAANLFAFVVILHFINVTLTWFGRRAGIEKLTYEVAQQHA